jgi:hypothetical protein
MVTVYLGTFTTSGNLSSATENPVGLNRREIGFDVGEAPKNSLFVKHLTLLTAHRWLLSFFAHV